MSLFVRNDEDNTYEAEIGGIRFVCQEPNPEYESASKDLADAYEEKLLEIVKFMMDDITDIFGNMSADELTEALGTPEIDLDRNIISYSEQTLDDSHVIDVEYSGIFEDLYEVIIDG